MRLFHYTIADRLPDIEASGEIRPATAGVPAYEKPIVWCSYNQDWEETANKMFGGSDGQLHKGTKETTHELGGGLARIEVRPESCPLDWKQYKAESGIKARTAKGLFNAAIDAGAKPSEWRGSFAPIPASEWLAVEIFDGGNWNRRGE